MPILPFRLSEAAKKKRIDFRVFFSSALVGTFLGLLASLIGPSFSLQNAIVVEESVVLIVATTILILYVMRIVLKPEELHYIIPIYLAYNKDKGMIVPITTRIDGFVECSFMKMRYGVEKNPEPSIVLKEQGAVGAQRLAVDIVVYTLFDWLSSRYIISWAPKMRYHGVGYDRLSWKGKGEVQSITIKYLELSEELRSKNIFFQFYQDTLMTHGRLEFHVPCDTELVWKIEEAVKSSSLSFKNRYCTVELKVSPSQWGVGLFPVWGKFIVAHGHDEKDMFTYMQDHYAHVMLEMDFRARFNWFRSLMESSDNYFNWVEDFLDGLVEFFSFEREYEALEKVGKKFELE